VLNRHEELLSRDEQKWRTNLGVTSDMHDKLHSLLSSYVSVFQLAHVHADMENVLYAVGQPLYAGMAEVADASTRLNTLAPIDDALDSFCKNYHEVLGRGNWSRAFSDRDRLIERFEGRTDARLRLLEAEREVLQWLVNQDGTWTIINNGNGPVPNFADPDLQIDFTALAQSLEEAFEKLQMQMQAASLMQMPKEEVASEFCTKR
jgi:hypothetical protein